MYKTMTVTVNECPQLREFIRTYLAGYRKKKVRLVATTQVTLDGGYWSGGSRSQWYVIYPYARKLVHPRYPTSPTQHGGEPAPTVFLGEGEFVAEMGTSDGKPATLCLRALPETFESVLGVRFNDTVCQ